MHFVDNYEKLVNNIREEESVYYLKLLNMPRSLKF
jgi:hypothetical protein